MKIYSWNFTIVPWILWGSGESSITVNFQARQTRFEKAHRCEDWCCHVVITSWWCQPIWSNWKSSLRDENTKYLSCHQPVISGRWFNGAWSLEKKKITQLFPNQRFLNPFLWPPFFGSWAFHLDHCLAIVQLAKWASAEVTTDGLSFFEHIVSSWNTLKALLHLKDHLHFSTNLSFIYTASPHVNEFHDFHGVTLFLKCFFLWILRHFT